MLANSRPTQHAQGNSQLAPKRKPFKQLNNETILKLVDTSIEPEVSNCENKDFTLVTNKLKSSPTTVDIIKTCHGQLTELSKDGKKRANGSEIDNNVRKVQKQVWKWKGNKMCENTLRKLGVLLENCDLIIGVDATPESQAGYCVNLVTKRLFWYKLNKNDFPLGLDENPSSSEFEMKNLMFALTAWETEILKYKRATIYTDNGAIAIEKLDEKAYGKEVNALLNHYSDCEGVSILNRGGIWVNKFGSEAGLAKFACFIQPADDLSRGHIKESLDFLSKMYGIDSPNVRKIDETDWRLVST